MHLHSTLVDGSGEPYQSIDFKEFSHIVDEAFRELDKQGFKDLFNITSSHIGCHFGNTELFEEFRRQGILVDCSCLPGLKSEGDVLGGSNTRFNFYDWTIAPHYPYYPDKDNYQAPAQASKTKQPSTQLLEIPVTTIDKTPFTLSAHSSWTRKHIQTAFYTAKNQNNVVFLHGWMHCFDVMSKKGMANFKKNIDIINQEAKNHDVPFEFITVSTARKIWESTPREKHSTEFIIPRKINYSFSDRVYMLVSNIYNWQKSKN